MFELIPIGFQIFIGEDRHYLNVGSVENTIYQYSYPFFSPNPIAITSGIPAEVHDFFLSFRL